MNIRNIKPKIWLYIAAVMMTLTGISRGIKGVLLLTSHYENDAMHKISSALYYQTGAILIFIMIIFVTGAFMLFKYRNKEGWLLGWVGIIFLFMGIILNGLLLFVVPLTRLLIINSLDGIIIILGLIFGRKAIVEE